MSKELEALEFICKILKEKGIDIKWLFKEQYNTIKQRLESIDNANPSEAMECLEWLIKNYIGNDYYVYEEELTTIKQALLKAQEQENVLNIVFEKRIDLESFYTSFIEGNCGYNFYYIHYGAYGLKCLTGKEFELLKAYFEKNIQK